jgi:hypothetical protein
MLDLVKFDKRWILKRFKNQSEVIGYLYDRYAENDEGIAKSIDKFLAGNEEWKSFLAAIQVGDSLAWFRSEPQSWKTGRGFEGFLIEREEKIIKAFVTLSG